MNPNLFRCTPRQARRLLLQIFEAGLVPFLRSSPGVGKSEIHHSIAADLGWWKIDHRLSSSDPVDLSGFAMKNERGRASYTPFDLFPIEGDQLPEGYVGWLLFLDEFNSAPRSVQAAAYKLILDRMVGQHRLHENVVVSCAGNLDSDKAITTALSTAMQSRMVHLEMEVNHQEWLEDVALPRGYDHRIIAFLQQFPSKLMDFRPEHQDRTFCCPRTWDFTNRLIKDKELDQRDAPALLTGTLTAGVATEFIQYCEIYKDLVSLHDIRRDPRTCRVPEKTALKWATIIHMMEKIDEENFSDLATYADRFTTDFRVLFYRSILIRKPSLRNHPVFTRSAVQLAQYLAA